MHIAHNARVASTAAFVAALSLANIGCAQTTKPAYESRFDTLTEGWSIVQVQQSPNRERTFLGGFVDELVTFSATNLPKHDYVRVSFDLLIILTWDGNGHSGYTVGGSTAVGPDWFQASVRNGPILMADTFSNIPDVEGFKRPTKFQSYPSPVPGDQIASQTSAVEKNELGFIYEAGPGFPMDAVYHVSLLVPHDQASITLDFKALLRDPVKIPRLLQPEECWGIDQFVVEALPASAVKSLDAKSAAETLDAATDAKKPADAQKAFWTLVGGGDESRHVLLDARANSGVDWKEVDRLIAALHGNDASAQQKLTAIGAVIETPLRVAMRVTDRDADNVDFFDKAQAILDDVQGRPIKDPAQRRAAVANRALEIMGGK
jgi:hypothetical protein